MAIVICSEGTTKREQLALKMKITESDLKAAGFKVISFHGRGSHYFTVQDEKGAQLYVHMDEMLKGFYIDVKHKYSYGSGSTHGLYRRVQWTILFSTILGAFKIANSMAKQYGYPEPLREEGEKIEQAATKKCSKNK